MKLLTIVVPTYNTAEVLPRCLDSLIVNNDLKELIEVLVVIDGSPDDSYQVACGYQENYPELFQVILKENGGHGSTINMGLKVATGKYFRVLDSDDWFDMHSFELFLIDLKTLDADIIITNYSKQYLFENRTEQMKLNLQSNKTYELESFDYSENYRTLFAMARCAFKTSILRESQLYLPEKIFYVDTLMSFTPIYLARNIVFIDIDLYQYFIGRDEQSVSQENVLKNRSHFLRVIALIWEEYRTKQSTISLKKKSYFNRFLSSLFIERYLILNRLPYQIAKKEIRDWHNFVKQTQNEICVKNKVIIMYQYLPYFAFRYIVKNILRY